MELELKAFSKQLSKLLRYDAKRYGLPLYAGNYVPVSGVTELFRCTRYHILCIVKWSVGKYNGQPRFELLVQHGVEWIRATRKINLGEPRSRQAVFPLQRKRKIFFPEVLSLQRKRKIFFREKTPTFYPYRWGWDEPEADVSEVCGSVGGQGGERVNDLRSRDESEADVSDVFGSVGGQGGGRLDDVWSEY